MLNFFKEQHDKNEPIQKPAETIQNMTLAELKEQINNLEDGVVLRISLQDESEV